MKTRLLLLVLTLLSFRAFSTVISVVNGDNLQTKINDATAGDVLIVGPGVYQTNSNIRLNKKLNIIGPGYFKSGGTALILSIYFDPGSAGSYLSGIETIYDCHILVDNITVTRNKINGRVFWAMIMREATSIRLMQRSHKIMLGV